ncbi:MAG: GTPase HflX, partial [Candidatus Aenigmarchaeota archaeon]|nr:GTPase HflX [Candidatus Aenigmarchaeota archaeon]
IAELSYEANKEIAVIINRRGQIINITVGDADSLNLGNFKNIREGSARLCGLRCIHTHLSENPGLSISDTTALERYRFDILACIGVNPGSKFSKKHGETVKFADFITTAFLTPEKDKEGNNFKVLETTTLRQASENNFLELLENIEQEFAKKSDTVISDLEEKAILVSLQTPEMSDILLRESLFELEQLTYTAGAKVLDKLVQKRNRPDSLTYIGKGKAEELTLLVQEKNANLVIIDSELSPRQQKKLEEIVQVKTIDRTELILDIFAQRAGTKEGKFQVELAQLKYLYPRLIGEGLSLSRQMGGGHGGGIATRGPGETKLEIDRRRIRQKIKILENEVEQIKNHRNRQRKLRAKNQIPIVSIVGYTNTGKSTLLNALSGSDVLVENKLFATLDPTIRKIKLQNMSDVLLTDTVGFIQRLPTSLVKAFRATLEEVTQADLILHVIDPVHPACMEQVGTVYDILIELDADKKPIISVINKIDLVKDEKIFDELSEKLPNPIKISALKRKGFGSLLNKIQEILD